MTSALVRVEQLNASIATALVSERFLFLSVRLRSVFCFTLRRNYPVSNLLLIVDDSTL